MNAKLLVLRSLLIFTIPCLHVGGTIVDQRNNYCEVYKKVEVGDKSRRTALNGLNVSVGVLPYVIDETGNLDQNYLAVKVFNEIARRGKFQYKNSFGVVPYPRANETYTNVLLNTLSNYDVALDWWIRSFERTSLGISGVKGWFDSSTIMIKRNDDNEDSKVQIMSFAKPFSWNLWAVFIFTMFFTAFAYHGIEYIAHRGDRGSRNTIGGHLYQTSMSFTGNLDFEPRATTLRIVVVWMAILTLVVTSAYTANLASFMITKNEEKPIQGFEDVIKYDYHICVWRGSGDVIQIQFDYPDGKYVEKDSELEVYQGLVNKECDIALTFVERYNEVVTKDDYNPNCNLEIVGRPVRVGSSSFAVKNSVEKCSSILRDVFDVFLLEMIEDKTLEKIKDEHYRGAKDCGQEEEDEDEAQLTIKDLGGIFILYYLALIFAFILAMLQAKFPRTFSFVDGDTIRKATDPIKREVIRRMSSIIDLTSMDEFNEEINDDVENVEESVPNKELPTEDSNEFDEEEFMRLASTDKLVKMLYREVIKIRDKLPNSEAESEK